MLGEFRKFLLRGNVLDLAVAVVMGAAFTGVVNSLVKDLITPLIAALVGKPDFSGLTFTINGAVFTYGVFLNTFINLVLVGAAIFFLVVKPINALTERMNRGEAAAPPATKQCPECLGEVPFAARRCKFCASQIAPPA